MSIASTMPAALGCMEVCSNCFEVMAGTSDPAQISLEGEELCAALQCACAGPQRADIMDMLLISLSAGESCFPMLFVGPGDQGSSTAHFAW